MRANSFITLIGITVVAVCAVGCVDKSPEVVKIGLVAPFEGRYREIGVDVIPAVRLAIREWAQQHPNGPYTVELVAYDDAADPEQAAEQANKLLADPAVAVVIGHWRTDTTAAVTSIYSAAGLPLVTYSSIDLPSDSLIFNIAPSTTAIEGSLDAWASDNDFQSQTTLTTQPDLIDSAELLAEDSNNIIGDSTWGLGQFYYLTNGDADGSYFVSGFAMPEDLHGAYWTPAQIQAFDEGFRKGSLGAPPGLFSVAAYEAAWIALSIIEADRNLDSKMPNPSQYMDFDSVGRRIDAPIYLYQWVDGIRELVTFFN